MTVTRPCGPHVGIDAAEAGIPCPVCGLGTPTPTDTDWLDELEQAAHAAILNFVPVRPATVLRLINEIRRLTATERQLLAAVAAGEMSDGYHTHNELYEYRLLYNAHAAHGWRDAGIPVVKSWRHSDGELCFGGGWFIVVATLPTGQVSNHYKAERWDLFRVPEVDLPPEYDGHTPADAADRLRAALEGGER